MSPTNRILAIEDDADTQANLRDILELDGYHVDGAGRISEALKHRNWPDYTAILLDRRLPDGMAEDLLPQLAKLAPGTAVVVVTASTDWYATITALRHGVSDYLLKPIDPQALRGSLQRIHQIREAEERAQQADRLATIGGMMTVLAHESRNAFQLVGANLDLLTLLLEDNEQGLKLVQRVRNHQARISRLFEDLRGYAAPIQLDRQQADLAAIIRNTVDEVRLLNPTRVLQVEVTRAPDSTLPVADVDVFRIEQVIRNLLENSLAACADPVEIWIQCAVTETVNGSNTTHVEVCYEDNGPGLSTECRRHLFEPFYTTKTKGTGLGMAISRRIIEAHGGTIDATSADRRTGASFRVTIPVHLPTAESQF